MLGCVFVIPHANRSWILVTCFTTRDQVATTRHFPSNCILRVALKESWRRLMPAVGTPCCRIRQYRVTTGLSFLGREQQWFSMSCCQHGEDVPRKDCSLHWLGRVVELQPGLPCVSPPIRGIPQDCVCSMLFDITRNPQCPDESTYQSVRDRIIYHKGVAITGRINGTHLLFRQENRCFNNAFCSSDHPSSEPVEVLKSTNSPLLPPLSFWGL